VALRDRRRVWFLVSAVAAILLSGPVAENASGEEREELGIEAWLASYRGTEPDGRVAIFVANHTKLPKTHQWYITRDGEVLLRGTLKVDAYTKERLTIPPKIQGLDGWVSFHLGSGDVELRWRGKTK